MANENENFPQLKSIERISKIPVVEKSVDWSTSVYYRIKNMNPLVRWSLNNMEGGVILAINASVVPVVPLIQTPLIYMDSFVNKSLETIEQRVPAINYPPEQIISMTKEMVSNTFVQPVLKRADSVKAFSVQEATKYGNIAASHLDSALDVADKYVEKYLPDSTDTVDAPEADDAEQEESKTVKTIHHVNRFSKKLQRRLTKRTIAEARALQKQSKDAAQVALYMLELLVKDPRQFVEKVKAIWAHYSLDEPENQVPPENLEQLLGMFAREMTRRFVHLTNYTFATARKLPSHARSLTLRTVEAVVYYIGSTVEYIIKTVHLEGAVEKCTAYALEKFGNQVTKLQVRADHLYVILLKYLETIDNWVKKRLSDRMSLSQDIPLRPIEESTASDNEKNEQTEQSPERASRNERTESKSPSSTNGSACPESPEN